jgi:hypothetical protein
MAAIAALSIQTVMLIVRRMARETFGLEFLFKFICNMTVGAGDIVMRAGQREVCPGRVIEERFSPGAADMTKRAISTIETLVCIVRAMTCVTLSRGIQIARPCMARCALGTQVAADQRITGLGTVIELSFAPFGRDMTGLAVPVECTLVLIIIGMAIETERGRLAMFFADPVTIFTDNLPVRPNQNKIGQLMIESLRVERYDSRTTTCVLGVACCALLCIGILIAAMVADPVPHITGDIFMAGLAQLPLLLAGKGDMATLAI